MGKLYLTYLSINQFNEVPDLNQSTLRDIYNDKDEEIIERINARQSWLSFQKKVTEKVRKIHGLEGMTANERMAATGLLTDFEELKAKDKKYARFILESLKVDEQSIQKILK
ncbi:hypothetical protein [Rufibacter quisquiliarum]|uniref:Uncharacterized protein n=1 Tax=Rufibacter quisquiliarum TaxID=1549639 RepID=A0A839GYG7_9BACT|nr:hypothetical protein [Rufibacter quisquiliarum]MBA9079867.1 hypothetical protein [Rufibacter quisquiliarum]